MFVDGKRVPYVPPSLPEPGPDEPLAARTPLGSADNDAIPVGYGDRLVPASYLGLINRGRWNRTVPTKAVHGYLMRYAHLQVQLDRAMGRALVRLKTCDGFSRLGFARPGDYARERLGLSPRWAQRRIRQERALVELAELARAYESGDVTGSKVDVLLSVVTPENERSWIERARSLTVRALTDEVKKAKRAVDATDAEADGATDGDGASDGHPADDDAIDWQWIQCRAPVPTAHLFDFSIEIARRASGSHSPVYQCVDHLMGEYVARIGFSVGGQEGSAEADDASPGDPIGAAPSTGDEGAMPASDDSFDGEGLERLRLELLAKRSAAYEPCYETRADTWSFLETPAERLTIDASLAGEIDTAEPLELDRRLRRLLRLRQIRHGEMARLLRTFKEQELWRELSFTSFKHYCHEMLGISVRLTQELVWADRKFEELPLLGKAYFGGRLCWAKTRLLLSICRRNTQRVWLERASKVTVRYLEREVATSRRKREADPEGWARDGGPLPLSHVPPYGQNSPVRPGVGLWDEDYRAGIRAGNGNGDANGDRADRANGTRPSAGGVGGNGAAAHADAHTLAPPSPRRSSPNLPCMIRFRLPPESARLWGLINADIERRAGKKLPPWQRLMILLENFLETWENADKQRYAKDRRILERDGYQCTAPGCLARRNTNGHHMHVLSKGGPDDPENVTTLCASHHHRNVHGNGAVTCRGKAPDQINWALPVGKYIGDVRVPS